MKNRVLLILSILGVIGCMCACDSSRRVVDERQKLVLEIVNSRDYMFSIGKSGVDYLLDPSQSQLITSFSGYYYVRGDTLVMYYNDVKMDRQDIYKCKISDYMREKNGRGEIEVKFSAMRYDPKQEKFLPMPFLLKIRPSGLMDIYVDKVYYSGSLLLEGEYRFLKDN